MPSLAKVLGLAALTISGAVAQNCTPTFINTGREVYAYVTGEWTATPSVSAGAKIIMANSGHKFVVASDASNNVSFKTGSGQFALTGASTLTLEAANDSDVLQKYTISCAQCVENTPGARTLATGCQIKPVSNAEACVTTQGLGNEVITSPCSGFIPGQGRFFHFKGV